MTNSLYQRDVVAINDLTKDEITKIIELAIELKDNGVPHSLQGKLVASCFFEPSTRTRLSFEAAAQRLGANIIGFSDVASTSGKKGESLSDTVKMMSAYADLMVIRHPQEGSARLAADVATIPVINAGDGANQHPTQTLLDLMTIQECQESLTDLRIAFVGDLKYGRTVHSLAQAMTHFGGRFYFVCPESLAMPNEICDLFKANNMSFSFHQSLDEVISKVDILYMTRLQKERFLANEAAAFSDKLRLTPDLLTKAQKNLRVMHPLPRVDEIDVAVDDTPHAYYFQQAANGVFVREALLHLILND